jgi:hypothetical protein
MLKLVFKFFVLNTGEKSCVAVACVRGSLRSESAEAPTALTGDSQTSRHKARPLRQAGMQKLLGSG